MAIQPVKYPHISELTTDATTGHLTVTEETVSTQPIMSTTPQQLVQPLNVTRVTPRLDTRRDLADTGASVSATGILGILHEFTSTTMYEIMGYDGTVTKAAGQSIAHVYQAATGKTEPMLFVYVPTITGTIISLEHHARAHPDIHRWVQEATPTSHNSGWLGYVLRSGRPPSISIPDPVTYRPVLHPRHDLPTSKHNIFCGAQHTFHDLPSTNNIS
jgi:hypothetical protein